MFSQVYLLHIFVLSYKKIILFLKVLSLVPLGTATKTHTILS